MVVQAEGSEALMRYQMLTAWHPEKIKKDFENYGKARLYALHYVVRTFARYENGLQLDTVLANHSMTKAHAPMHYVSTAFNDTDIRFVWDYLLKHKLIRRELNYGQS